MKLSGIFSLAVALSLFGSANVYAAPKTYQVTGPILEVTDKIIVVQKGDERWEIARDQSTKLLGVVKVGEKVTIYYRMVATSIESKLENGEKPTGDKKKSKETK
jgi:hypothetical protein